MTTILVERAVADVDPEQRAAAQALVTSIDGATPEVKEAVIKYVQPRSLTYACTCMCTPCWHGLVME